MTAPDMHLSAEVDAVIAARAVLRSHAPHSVGTIRQACLMLQRYGDGTDWLEAREMYQAMERKAEARRIPITRTPYSPPVVRIRDVLVGTAVGVWGVWLMLVVWLGMSG